MCQFLKKNMVVHLMLRMKGYFPHCARGEAHKQYHLGGRIGAGVLKPMMHTCPQAPGGLDRMESRSTPKIERGEVNEWLIL